MKPERYRQIEELYHAALERMPEERVAFLAGACAGDEVLRAEVEALLTYDLRGDQLLDRPALELVALMGEQRRGS